MNTHLHDFMSQHLSSAIAKEISVTYHDNHIPDCMTELPVVANNIILPAFEMPTDENTSQKNLKKKGPVLPFTGSPGTRYPKLDVE